MQLSVQYSQNLLLLQNADNLKKENNEQDRQTHANKYQKINYIGFILLKYFSHIFFIKKCVRVQKKGVDKDY